MAVEKAVPPHHQAQNLIPIRMDLCAELASARRESGLSQQALANTLGVPRLAITRLEAGKGSAELALKALDVLKVRFKRVATGTRLLEQVVKARKRRGWSIDDVATRARLDPRTVAAVESGSGNVASLSAMLSVLAPRAEKSVADKTYWSYNRAEVAERDTRFTPIELIDAIEGVAGEIALDPCYHPASPIRALRMIQLPECGLEAQWRTPGLVYINPPFSDLSPWLVKACREWAGGEIGKMIFMLPTPRLDIRAYAEGAANVATTLFLKKRMRFGSVNREHHFPIPFAIALLFWGFEEDEIEDFRQRVPSMVMGPQRA